MSLPAHYQTAEGLRTLANYLRSQNGVKVRSGIEHEKRVEYFKGKKLVECLLEAKKWPKSIPVITDKEIARLVASALIQGAFFHRSEKVEDKKGYLMISKRNVFEESGYYTWMYSGNMVWSNIATGLVVAVVIICTLMPIWPAAAKHVLWYCSVTFLIVIFTLLTMRGLSFLFMWLLGYDFWVFPRLFDESLSFQDSFRPVYTFEKGSPGQGYYRVGMLVVLVGFVYWAYTQPTEFDGYIKAQKVFIEDLYAGNLLADVAHSPAAHLDRSKRVPSLEDLLKAMEADEKEKIGGADEDGNPLSDNISETLSAEEGDSLLNGEWVNVDPATAGSAKEARDAREKEAREESARESDEAQESQERGEEGDAAEAEWIPPDHDQEESDM